MNMLEMEMRPGYVVLMDREGVRIWVREGDASFDGEDLVVFNHERCKGMRDGD